MQNIVKNEAVKKTIPYGGIKEIAKASKTSIYTVSRVVNGRSKNIAVKKAITEYLKNLKATDEELSNSVSSLYN